MLVLDIEEEGQADLEREERALIDGFLLVSDDGRRGRDITITPLKTAGPECGTLRSFSCQPVKLQTMSGIYIRHGIQSNIL